MQEKIKLDIVTSDYLYNNFVAMATVQETGTQTTTPSYLETRGSHPAPRRQLPLKYVGTYVLRLLALGASLAAFILIVQDNQHIFIPTVFTPDSVQLIASQDEKWSYSSALMWFMISTAIAAVYSFVAILVSVCLGCQKSRPESGLCTIFILDLIMVNVLTSGFSSALNFIILGKYGYSKEGWGKFCNNYDRFCNHIIGALISSGIGVVALLQVCILDAYHLYNGNGQA